MSDKWAWAHALVEQSRGVKRLYELEGEEPEASMLPLCLAMLKHPLLGIRGLGARVLERGGEYVWPDDGPQIAQALLTVAQANPTGHACRDALRAMCEFPSGCGPLLGRLLDLAEKSSHRYHLADIFGEAEPTVVFPLIEARFAGMSSEEAELAVNILERVGRELPEEVRGFWEGVIEARGANWRAALRGLYLLNDEVIEPSLPLLLGLLDEPSVREDAMAYSRLLMLLRQLGPVAGEAKSVLESLCREDFAKGDLDPQVLDALIAVAKTDALQLLLEFLREGTPMDKVEVLSALSTLGMKLREPLEDLLPIFDEASYHLQHRIIRLLGEFAQPSEEVLALLEKQLTSDDPDRRHEAAKALSKTGAKAKGCFASLAEALSDPSDDVRSNIAWALGECKDQAKEATAALARVLEDFPDEPNINVLLSLGEFGEEAKEAAPQVLAVLQRKHFHWQARANAAWALGCMGDLPEDDLTNMQAMLNEPEDDGDYDEFDDSEASEQEPEMSPTQKKLEEAGFDDFFFQGESPYENFRMELLTALLKLGKQKDFTFTQLHEAFWLQARQVVHHLEKPKIRMAYLACQDLLLVVHVFTEELQRLFGEASLEGFKRKQLGHRLLQDFGVVQSKLKEMLAAIAGKDAQHKGFLLRQEEKARFSKVIEDIGNVEQRLRGLEQTILEEIIARFQRDLENEMF